MVSKLELTKIKEDLLARKQEIERELQNLSNEKMVDGESQDDGDQVVLLTMETVRQSLQGTEYNEYTNIISALNSIEAGTYGVCEECHERISENRLKYNPNARRCISCQEKAEKANF
ncbi:MAG: TraR/DksA family transcriptional regulator [Candidatus Dependentiae bacterium]|nr:TraR/DksA family transcriptional regulator [Candidatus Dependentiae bacterium]